MATAAILSRYAADDRKGPKSASPFRSKSDEKRFLGAVTMMAKRSDEIAALEKALSGHLSAADRKRALLRLQASKNNLQSWTDYVEEGWPRETRAVITPHH